MANKKISELTALTAPAAADVLPIVDISASETKKITFANLAGGASATELGYVSGVTSAIQTQIDTKAPIASPTFTGVVTIPTPFTLGAVSVIATGTELNYVDGVTSAIQTQLDTKLTNVLEDTTPQLGGDLDINAHAIVSTSNGDIVLTPNGTGRVTGVYRYIEIRLLEAATAHTVATVGGEFRVPRAMTVKNVGAYVDTAGVTGTATIDINEAGTTILSTKITIDTAEKTSETAATPPVISDSAIAADAILTFDIDVIQTTAAKGLVIWLEVII